MNKKTDFSLMLIFIFCFLYTHSSSSQERINSDLSCYNRIGGNWKFGSAPEACNVSPLLPKNYIQLEYTPVILNESNPNLMENRKKFMSEMYPLLRDVSTYYIKRRKPNVTQAEINGFTDGVLTLAHQESVWSHYRLSGSIIRYMRGDNLHGHGLMQVDDRAHTKVLKKGRGADLVYNILYGLDIYYSAWEKATKSGCLKSSTNYRDRARAAWSAYNGGAGSICRWSQNTSAGDQQYYQKFKKREWLSFIANTNASTKLNVLCLVEGKRPCSNGAPNPGLSPKNFLIDMDMDPLSIEIDTSLSDKSANEIADAIRSTIECYSFDCNYPHKDQKTYFFEVSKDIKRKLNTLALISKKNKVSDSAHFHDLINLITNSDGHVKEGALNLISSLPPSINNLNLILKFIIQDIDAELIPMALKELKRYPNEQALITKILADTLLQGTPFVALAISLQIKIFINDSNYNLFAELLKKLNPNSILYENLKAAM